MLRRRMFNSGDSAITVPTTVVASKNYGPVDTDGSKILINGIVMYKFTCTAPETTTQINLKIKKGDTLQIKHNGGPCSIISISGTKFTITLTNGTQEEVKMNFGGSAKENVWSDIYTVTSEISNIYISFFRYNGMCP